MSEVTCRAFILRDRGSALYPGERLERAVVVVLLAGYVVVLAVLGLGFYAVGLGFVIRGV
jgi:hypothetical protein